MGNKQIDLMWCQNPGTGLLEAGELPSAQLHGEHMQGAGGIRPHVSRCEGTAGTMGS